ncbi:energy-coupling factor ABC transporter ATP-binding protein [Taklimakanibacter deserti]|uniref:energy-coupling factor ABC transporter ATP-binding protein n=1 Tax=Taklimakanibacter deserti TaxID=2267839 RepID=UPI000E6570C4
MPITFSHVSFAYPNGSLAVDDVSFTVNAGERLAIVGQNGAGKTTTVKLMNGLLKPTSGTVMVDGVATADRSTASIAETVGYVFQNPDDQIFASTVRAEMEYMPRYRKWDDAKRDERVARAARLAGIEAFFDGNPNDLPLVIRKFVAIAAILVGECKYIVLDEPTAGLDRPGQRRLIGMIDQLEAEGISVVTITHDMRFVAQAFTRVIAMANCRIVADGTCSSLFSSDGLLRQASIRRPELAQLAKDLGLSDTAYGLNDVAALIPDMPRASQR